MQPLQVYEERNVFKTPFLSFYWLSLQFKKQERGHSALFKGLQAISWLFIHQEPQCSDRGDQ